MPYTKMRNMLGLPLSVPIFCSLSTVQRSISDGPRHILIKNRHTKILHNRLTAVPEDTVKKGFGSINHTFHVQKLLSADTLFNT